VGAVAPDGSFDRWSTARPSARRTSPPRDLARSSTRSTRPCVRRRSEHRGHRRARREFYTDDAHQHHIEVGFGDPPPSRRPAVASDPPPLAPPPIRHPRLRPIRRLAAPSQAASPAAGGTGGFAASPARPGGGRRDDRAGAVASTAPPGAATPTEAAAGAGPSSGVAADCSLAGAGTGKRAKALAASPSARSWAPVPPEEASTGFDCSGLMQWAYHQAGISIGRVTTQQIHDGVAVDRSHLIPGDLVFFQDSTGYVHHVGMYIGDDKFLHAPHTGDVVKVSSLSEPYYAHQFAGGRRMDTSAPVEAPAGLALDSAGAAPAEAAPAAAGAAASAAPAAGHGTGGFAALDAGRRGTPRSTVRATVGSVSPATRTTTRSAAASETIHCAEH
jgi:cell wall-associated NlpC family hydrolase